MNLSREEWARLTTPNCVQGFCSFNPPPHSLRTKNEKIVTLDRETNFVNSIWEYKSRWNLNTTDLVSNFFVPSLIHLHIYESHSTGFSFIFVKMHWFSCHCTKMYPMALRCCSPLSGECVASFPHVMKFSGFPPVPKPILESQLLQCFLWSEIMPALALE